MFPFDPFAKLLDKYFRWVSFGVGVTYLLAVFVLQGALHDGRVEMFWFATALPMANGGAALFYWLAARKRPGAVSGWIERVKTTARDNPGWAIFDVGTALWVTIFAGVFVLAPAQLPPETALRTLTNAFAAVLAGLLVVSVVVGLLFGRRRRA
jgi:hypothetical protein